MNIFVQMWKVLFDRMTIVSDIVNDIVVSSEHRRTWRACDLEAWSSKGCVEAWPSRGCVEGPSCRHRVGAGCSTSR